MKWIVTREVHSVEVSVTKLHWFFGICAIYKKASLNCLTLHLFISNTISPLPTVQKSFKQWENTRCGKYRFAQANRTENRTELCKRYCMCARDSSFFSPWNHSMDSQEKNIFISKNIFIRRFFVSSSMSSKTAKREEKKTTYLHIHFSARQSPFYSRKRNYFVILFVWKRYRTFLPPLFSFLPICLLFAFGPTLISLLPWPCFASWVHRH